MGQQLSLADACARSARYGRASSAVFLDRDGTIARDVPYCSRPEDFELFPRVPEAIRLLRDAGYAVVLVTNQSGVARGYFTERDLARIHDKLLTELSRRGAPLDAVYYCPHHPDDGCSCRKPQPGLILEAARELQIDLTSSYMVGDTPADVGAGQSAGCRTVLVGDAELAAGQAPDFAATDLLAAARWICAQPANGPAGGQA